VSNYDFVDDIVFQASVERCRLSSPSGTTSAGGQSGKFDPLKHAQKSRIPQQQPTYHKPLLRPASDLRDVGGYATGQCRSKRPRPGRRASQRTEPVSPPFGSMQTTIIGTLPGRIHRVREPHRALGSVVRSPAFARSGAPNQRHVCGPLAGHELYAIRLLSRYSVAPNAAE
jgi:hypothetical protein